MGDTAILGSVERFLAVTQAGLDEFSSRLTGQSELGQSLARAVALIAERKGRVIVSGVGKSGHIARKVAATLASTGTPAYFVHPTEASHGDLGMVGAEDVIICLSWSGETPELANILTYAKRFRVALIAITSNSASPLARNATVAIVLPKVREACSLGLAPTTSTLLQLVTGDALAIALLEHRGFSENDFREFHPAGKLGAQLRLVRDLAHTGAGMPIRPLGASMGDAVLTISEKGFGVVGIVDGAGVLVGIITDGDLRRHMRDDLLAASVEDVMSHNPRTIPGDTIASAALELMESNKITALFLVDGRGVPDGFVHIHDLLKAGVA